VEEDYAIVTLRELDPQPDGPLTDVVDVVPLLTQEVRPLSAAARAEVLRYAHSYYTDDAVVLTWDRALILEPGGDDDVADVLEVANAQLLELRVYDALLDREIPRVYDVAEAVQRRGVALFQRRYSRAANQMRTLVAEITEITERVDNALKVTEDVYLARVYTSATELFRIPALAASIDHKLSLIRETYTSLYDQAVAARAEWMEAAIIALIVLEVILAIVAGRH
jgi:CRISPR/Cas system CSM-associated protein Csm2 small subunit